VPACSALTAHVKEQQSQDSVLLPELAFLPPGSQRRRNLDAAVWQNAQEEQDHFRWIPLSASAPATIPGTRLLIEGGAASQSRLRLDTSGGYRRP